MSFSHLDPTTPEQSWRTAGIEHLPTVDIGLLDRANRMIVVGAHPDDEALGCAAVLANAAQAGLDTHVISYTSGEGSHPSSPTHSPVQLARRREAEFRAAMQQLHPRALLEFGNLPDGQLRHHEDEIAQNLMGLVNAAPRPVILVAPYSQDGHIDHETLGRVAQHVAAQTGIVLLEYPIWYWHWADPQDTRWHQWHRVPDPSGLDRRALYKAYPSQVLPLSGAPGDEAIVSPEFLAHFQRGFDTLIISERAYDARDAAAVFDQLHAEQDDPWSLTTSEYEQQKRQALLGIVGSGYRRTLEVGCSIGTLTMELAQRSEHVVALDASSAAIETARRRYWHQPNIDFHCLTVPFEWPEGQYDLVVLSEVGYFMAPEQLQKTLQRIHDSTDTTFVLALCHVLGEITGWPADAASVHQQCHDFWPEAKVVATADTQDYALEVLRIHKTTSARSPGAADDT